MSTDKLIEAMNMVGEMHEKSSPIKGGKKYTKVVNRVEAFRRTFGMDYSIQTEVMEFAGGVMVLASIYPSNKRDAVGNGHAWASNLAKEKSLEKLETTAIGRALASLGLGGDEYASDTEIETFDERYEKPNGKIKPIDKTNNRAIDYAFKAAMRHIIDCVDEESVTSVGRYQWKYCKDAGATEEQLGMIQDQVENKRMELRSRH